MRNADLKPMQQYVHGKGTALRGGCLIFAVFALCFPFAGGNAVLGGVIFGVIAFLFAAFDTRKRGKATESDLLATSSEAEAARDFANAQEAPGVGKVGEAYFFGHNTGVIVRFSDVSHIIRHVKEIPGNRAMNVEITLQFLLKSGQMRRLCLLFSRRQYQQAAAVLALIGDKCPMTAEVASLRSLYAAPDA